MTSRPSPVLLTDEDAARPVLEKLLGSFDAHAFLRDRFGVEPLLVRNVAPDMATAVTWEGINDALSRGARHPQVRLLRAGAPVPLDKYTVPRHDQRYVAADLCQRELTQGATMIFLASDLVVPGLSDLIQGLSEECRAQVRADLIVTLAPVAGLNLHWDQTECFNIQLAGRKQWDVFRPTRRWPLRPTPSHPERIDISDSAAPTGRPTMSDTIGPGDMLYLPRGWWHLVTPVETPCLHLSVSVDVPTASDALLWVVSRSGSEECIRQNLPLWASHDAWSAFVRAVHDALQLDRLGETLREYVAEWHEGLPTQESFQLPAKTPVLAARLRCGARVRLRRLRRLPYALENGDVVCGTEGKRYVFRASAAPALDRLDRRWRSLPELSNGTNEVVVQSMLDTLWRDDVVAVADARVTRTAPAPDSNSARASWRR